MSRSLALMKETARMLLVEEPDLAARLLVRVDERLETEGGLGEEAMLVMLEEIEADCRPPTRGVVDPLGPEPFPGGGDDGNGGPDGLAEMAARKETHRMNLMTRLAFADHEHLELMPGHLRAYQREVQVLLEAVRRRRREGDPSTLAAMHEIVRNWVEESLKAALVWVYATSLKVRLHLDKRHRRLREEKAGEETGSAPGPRPPSEGRRPTVLLNALKVYQEELDGRAKDEKNDKRPAMDAWKGSLADELLRTWSEAHLAGELVWLRDFREILYGAQAMRN